MPTTEWKLHLRSDKNLDDLGRMFNAVIRGWVGYYGAFYKSALYATLTANSCCEQPGNLSACAGTDGGRHIGCKV